MDLWIMAGSYAEAKHYAESTGAGNHFFYVDRERVRGRRFSAETHLVYLSGFDNRPDCLDIEQELSILRQIHGDPSIEDRRDRVPDGILRNQRALTEWLAS